MKNIILISALVMFSFAAQAQNDIQLSQQSFSRIYYNPAATGQSEYMTFNLLNRSQWIGVNDAPQTMMFNMHKFLPKLNFGMGLCVVNDKLGLENNYNIKMAYAYHLKFNENLWLSMGIGAGVLSKNIDFGQMTMEDPENLSTDMENQWKPDFDAGMELAWKNLTVGASVTHVHQSKDASDLYSVPRHFYLYTRYQANISENTVISPAFSVNSCFYRTQYEFNVSAFSNEFLYYGLSYRFEEAIVLLAGVQINERFRLNYSYDIPSGPMINQNSGSHEILLQIKLGSGGNIVQPSPRFFD